MLLASVMACGAPPPLPEPPRIDLAVLAPGTSHQFDAPIAAFQQSPTDASANRELAKLLLAYEMYDAAEGYLRRACLLDPRDDQARYLLGWLHATTGAVEEAVADFDRVLALVADHPQAMLRRADALRRLNRLPEAREAFDAVLKVYPDQPNALFGRGSVLLAQGQPREAVAVLREVTATEGEYGAANYALGQAYRALGDTENARRYLARYQASRTTEPKFEDPAVDAVADLKRNHQALYERSLKLAAAGNWAAAAVLLEEATSLDPNFLVGHVNLIICYSNLRNARKLEEHYGKALALSPDSAELHNTMGLAAKFDGRLADARAEFRRSIEADPRHATAYENLGQLEVDAGNLDAALRDFEQAAEIAPSSARAWMMVGTLRLKRGRGGEAGAAFMHLVRPGADTGGLLGAVRKEYQSAGDDAGWRAFAAAALVRAQQTGLPAVASQLTSMTR